VKEPFRQKTQQHCVQTKNIHSLLDLNIQDVMYKTLANHELTCTLCSKALKKIKEQNLSIKVFIPKPYMPKDLRETYSGELSELFKTAGLNDIKNKKLKIKNNLKALDRMGEILINNLFSKSMLKAYASAFLVFLGLRYIL
jgi:hypothetical protein